AARGHRALRPHLHPRAWADHRRDRATRCHPGAAHVAHGGRASMIDDLPAGGSGASPAPVAVTRTTNEDVRAQNLSAVLHLVHAAGAQSRSEIGAVTGLNRSTVTALVQELLDLRLVREESVKPTGRVGRPSL